MTLAALLLAVTTVSSLGELFQAVTNNIPDVRFDIQATLMHNLASNRISFVVQNQTGSIILFRQKAASTNAIAAGSMLRVQGRTIRGERRHAWVRCSSLELLAPGKAPVPPLVTIEEYNAGKYDHHYIQLRGTVLEEFKDELYPGIYLVLGTSNDVAYACYPIADISTRPNLIGCEITICGICDPDDGGARHHYGRTLSARDGIEAFTIIRKPPFWTSRHLLIAVFVLLGCLVLATSWIILLHIAVERRSHALLDERLAHLESELKTGERTRLAVELHDSIAQALTGVAMQLRTADILADDARLARNHISLATKILDACRGQLRNCIWDLRNLTLDETSIADAIRRTLAPHVSFEHLAIRFNVPRERFSEHTAHTILSIIRELAINAVRHGRATSLKIAGSIENDKFLFSVKDNGCGFEPDSAPGVAQGHFGLQGIRDRIKVFGGETTVVSSPGQGTKVTIALNTPSSDKVSNS